MAARSKKKAKRKTLRTEVDALLRRVDRLPDLDSRTPDEIIGYDQHGLPQSGERIRVTEPTASDEASADKYPSFASRRKKIFGNRVLTAADDLIKDRGRY